jgi:hypothetical protein
MVDPKCAKFSTLNEDPQRTCEKMEKEDPNRVVPKME